MGMLHLLRHLFEDYLFCFCHQVTTFHFIYCSEYSRIVICSPNHKEISTQVSRFCVQPLRDYKLVGKDIGL